MKTLPLTHALHHKTCRHASYMLSCDEFDALYGDGDCHICGRSEIQIFTRYRTRLFIDHVGGGPHWRVRGLLCVSCNSALQDDVRFNSAAASYLANPYWRTLGESPSEPQRNRISVRWGTTLERHDDGLWHATLYRAQRKAKTWSQLCHALGPRLLVSPRR